MTVALSSLRVQADFDSSKYQTGMRGKVSADQAGAASSMAVGRAMDQGAAAAQKYQAALERQERAAKLGLVTTEQLGQSVQDLAAKYDRQVDAISASAEATRRAVAANQAALAANDNAAQSVSKVGSAFRETAKFALEHPLLVAAGTVLAARALSGYAATAAGAMGRASVATAAYAAEASTMGSAVAGAAGVAAAGLRLGERAALAASVGFAGYADKVSGLTTATGLLSRGLGAIGPLLGPIALGFVAFELASATLRKAINDFDRLVEVGRQAERLDLSAPFIRSFEGLGTKLRLEVEEVQKAYSQAADFVRDRFDQFNALEKQIGDLQKKGYASSGIEDARQQASVATTNESRIKASLVAMKELEAAGYRFAALDLAGKVFGPELESRLRTGQVTIEKMAADLDEAQRKQVLRQEDVDRALALSRAIDDTKQRISEAVSVAFDFAHLGESLKEIWLYILQKVEGVVATLREAIGAAGEWFKTLDAGITSTLNKLGNWSGFAKINEWMEKAGVSGMSGVQPFTSNDRQALEIRVAPRADNSGRAMPYQFDAQIQAWKAYTDAQNRATKATKDGQAQTADAFDNALQRIKDQTQELKLQADVAGKNTEEVYRLTEANRLWRAARQSGRQDEKGIAEAIDDATAAYARQRVATDAVLEAQRRLKDGQREMAQAFGGFVEDLISGSGKVVDAFSSIGKQFIGMGVRGLFSGEGMFGNLLGLAPTEKGGVGGLFGGGFFSSLKDATKEGTSGGFLDGIKSLFGGGSGDSAKAATPAGGSLLGAGAGALALFSSYGVGRSAKSPTQGALGGAVSGAVGGAMLGSYFMPGIGTAVGAVAGAVVGGGLGFLGGNAAKRQKEREEKLERWNRYVDALPSITELGRTLRGDGQGDLVKTITASQTEIAKAAKIAAEAGQTDVANALVRDGHLFAARMRQNFLAGLEAQVAEMRDGLGLSGPFVTALKRTQDLTEQLKGWLGDVADATNHGAEAFRIATEAAWEMAASSLDGAKELSGVQQRLADIRGTAAGLVDVLVKLGMGAEDAARVVEGRMNAALGALRTSFETDLTRKIDDVQGRGYANDLRDLLDEIATLRSDASALGLGQGRVDAYFTSAAQKIVDEAELTGSAFEALTREFPDLIGNVHAFTGAVTQAASASEIAARRVGYQDRVFGATNDTSTLEGQLLAFDRAAQREREDEIKAGGAAIADLESALYVERLKILRDYNEQAAESERQKLEEAQRSFDTFARNVKQFVDGLRAGSSSPLSPQARLAAAQGQYDAQLALARTGDRTALDGITGYASDLLDAAKAFYASSAQFQTIFESVTGQLTALPSQVAPEQFIVDAVTDLKSSLLASLSLHFDDLDANVNGLLDFNEFKAGLGPLATSAEQQAARAIFNAIDSNGDGQIDRLELMRSQLGSSVVLLDQSKAVQSDVLIRTAETAAAAAGTKGSVDYSNSVLAELKTLNNRQLEQQTLNAKLVGYGGPVANNEITALNKIVYNTAITDAHKNAGNGAYASGGWVSGPGTGTSDSISAMLSNGEFVVRAASAGRYGDLLEAMNDNRDFSLPTFGMPMPVAGGFDVGAIVAELRALRGDIAHLTERVERLEASNIAVTRDAGEHVREGVDVVAAGQRRAASDAVQVASRPKRSGTNG